MMAKHIASSRGKYKTIRSQIQNSMEWRGWNVRFFDRAVLSYTLRFQKLKLVTNIVRGRPDVTERFGPIACSRDAPTVSINDLVGDLVLCDIRWTREISRVTAIAHAFYRVVWLRNQIRQSDPARVHSAALIST